MKYLKNKRKKHTILLPVILLILVLLALCAFLVCYYLDENPMELLQNGIQLGNNTETSQFQETQGHILETEDGRVVDETFIETPYCKLYYPDHWQESISVEFMETENSYQVIFLGTVGEKTDWLYTLYFGESDINAYSVGMLKTISDEKIPVSVELSDLDLDNNWTEVEIDTMCAMQESVNHMIAHLEAEPGYSNS